MTSKKNPVQDYHLMPDLDGAILASLPPEGAKMGWQPLAKQVQHITKELCQVAPIASSQVSSRIRALHHHEMVVGVIVSPISRGKGWQRTKKGAEYAVEHGMLDANGKSTTKG